MEVEAYQAHHNRKEEGFRTNWAQGWTPAVWLHQEVTPSQGGPFWHGTQPQWERNRDQKKGIRIRESKVPAQNDHKPARGR
eukprot:3422796-Heterocapsa_arctica.AAC.1